MPGKALHYICVVRLTPQVNESQAVSEICGCIRRRENGNITNMKFKPYVIVLLLSVVCVVLSVSLVMTFRANQKMQAQLQANQQILNSGILGPQGQQIGNNLLQDMANSATRNPDMRKLLAKYGYQIQEADSAATNALDTARSSIVEKQVEAAK
jgi:Na+-transporting NADH:ubiquinone oxidoreductase subunit NqrC